jgi:hypothetical protein
MERLEKLSLEASTNEGLKERLLSTVDQRFVFDGERGADLSIDRLHAEMYRDIADLKSRTGFLKDTMEIFDKAKYEVMQQEAKAAVNNLIKTVRKVCG